MGEPDMQKIMRSVKARIRRQLFIQGAGTLIVLGAIYSITTLLWLFWPWTLWITGIVSAYYTVIAGIAYQNIYARLQGMSFLMMLEEMSQTVMEAEASPAPKSTSLPVPGPTTKQ